MLRPLRLAAIRLALLLGATALVTQPLRAQADRAIPSDPTLAPFSAPARSLTEVLTPERRLRDLDTGTYDATGTALQFDADGEPVLATALAGVQNLWREGFFSGPGAAGGDVRTITLTDDALYATGLFRNIGGDPLGDIAARYDFAAERWEGFDLPYTGFARQILVDGDDVYFGGAFSRPVGDGFEQAYLQRWNRATDVWDALGPFDRPADVFAGSEGVDMLRLIGDDLWVGGYFVNAGGIPEADVLAIWNTTTETWRSLGQIFEIDGDGGYATASEAVVFRDQVFVRCFCGFGDGIARTGLWDGTRWTGIDGFSENSLGKSPFAVRVFEDELYMIRSQSGINDGFIDVPGVPDDTQFIKWDGTTFTPLSGTFPDRSSAGTLDRFDGTWIVGLGSLGGAEHPYLMRYNGTDWEQLGPGLDGFGVSAITPAGDQLWVGGRFNRADDDPAQLNNIAVFDGTSFASIGPAGNGLVRSIGQDVSAITVYDGALVVGGRFEEASNDPDVNHVARWDGTRWQPLGGGLNESVNVFTQADGKLYAGGGFFDVNQDGNNNDNRLAVWDGASWEYFGQGFGNGRPKALAVIGDDIYVGGSINNVDDLIHADGIARWDGTQWHTLQEDPTDRVDMDDDVEVLLVDADGTLLVGGAFTDFYDLNYLARWDLGARDWRRIAAGAPDPNGDVNAIAFGPDGLYVGGAFSNLDGQNGGVARWDGSAWQPLGDGLQNADDILGDPIVPPVVTALYVNDGNVYVGGRFGSAGNVEGTLNLARWDGTTWHPISNGLDNTVSALGSFGTTLVAGGIFGATGDDTIVTQGIGFHPLPGTVANEDDALPEADARLAAWPNPTRATARVRLTVAEPQPVEVKLYDVLGRHVATLFDGEASPGAPIEATLPDGIAAGLYVVRATGPSVQATTRLSVLR